MYQVWQSKPRFLCFNVMNPIVDDDTEEENGLSANKIVGTDNSASYQLVKRQRRRTSSRDRSRSISITVATFDYSSSRIFAQQTTCQDSRSSLPDIFFTL